MRKTKVRAAPPKKGDVRTPASAKRSSPARTPAAPPSHVVGIGGSAGGPEALERFFRALQPSTTMSFVVVTHRDPSSKGMMVEILSRFTPLRVCDAKHGAALER